MIDAVSTIIKGLSSPWFAVPLLAVAMMLTFWALLNNRIADRAESYYDRQTGTIQRDAKGLREAKLHATTPLRVIIALWVLVIFIIAVPTLFRYVSSIPV